ALERARAFPELEQPWMIQVACQADKRQLLWIELSLEREVVNRQHTARVTEEWIVAQHRAQIDRGERALPVVCVDDGRTPPARRRQARILQRGASEQPEPE